MPKRTDQSEELLTPADLAEKWQVSVRTVHRYLADGRVKSIRTPGGRYRIRAEDADAAVKASA